MLAYLRELRDMTPRRFGVWLIGLLLRTTIFPKLARSVRCTTQRLSDLYLRGSAVAQ
jgi:hypothetical protein